jgi:hypothetical protein
MSQLYGSPWAYTGIAFTQDQESLQEIWCAYELAACLVHLANV